jgi:hypothetical protein
VWSVAEKKAVEQHLGVFIRLQKCPGKKDCEEAAKDERLQQRDWKAIKNCCRNMYLSKRRV